MKAIDQAKNLSAQRLDQFLDSALSNHLNEFRSVYAVFLKKSSESHVDFLDLFFTWNFEGAWKTHRGRPTNRNISEGAKWDPNEWIWYEDCPHQHYSGVSLFDGNHFFSDSDYHREDRLIQQKLQEENSHLSKLDVHLLFVKEVFGNVVTRFRQHELTVSAEITNVPFQLDVSGCPSYGEHYWEVSQDWNTNAGG